MKSENSNHYKAQMTAVSRSGHWAKSLKNHVAMVLQAGIAMCCTYLCTVASAGSTWPTDPITFIAPFSAGGGGDTLTRLYAHPLGSVLSVPIVVDNRPGAGGNIGTASAAKSAPDGQTVVFGTMGTMGTNHFLYKRTGFSINDFEPVALFGTTGLALVVAKEAPFKTIQELLTFGKKNPGKLSCASGGNGTASHLACAMLQQMAGMDVTHIPYKASSAAIVDVLTQRVSFLIDVTPVLTTQIKAGSLRALAVSTKRRLPALQAIPTMAESGMPDYEMFSWDGMFAPKGTPADRLDRLHAAIQTILKDPEFNQRMTERGVVLQAQSREEFNAMVLREYARMGSVVKRLGVTVD